MKLTFIILGVLIVLFVIVHSIREESERTEYMQYCHEQHIAEVGNMVHEAFRHLYNQSCAEDWSQYSSGRETEMVRKWRVKTTAKQAINQECKRCCGNVQTWREVCATPDCAIYFGRESGSSVRRIKEFCLKCNPLESVFGVKDCEGRYFDGSLCVLHAYRLGKNPNRVKRVWTDAERDVVRQRFALKSPARMP